MITFYLNIASNLTGHGRGKGAHGVGRKPTPTQTLSREHLILSLIEIYFPQSFAILGLNLISENG